MRLETMVGKHAKRIILLYWLPRGLQLIACEMKLSWRCACVGVDTDYEGTDIILFHNLEARAFSS